MIFIRGGPGSGKTWLANRILKKEAEMGNTRCRLITTNRYYHPTKFNRDHVERYMNNLRDEVEGTVDDGFYVFVIVEIEGGEQPIYDKLTEYANLVGGYEHYSIDILQDPDICLKYVKHPRGQNDIQKICKEIEDHVVPFYHKVLNPIEFIEPGWTARQPIPEPKKIRIPSPEPKRKSRFYKDETDSDEECFSCHG